MRAHLSIRMILLAALVGWSCFFRQTLHAVQGQEIAAPKPANTVDMAKPSSGELPGRSATKMDEIVDRVIKRENEEVGTFDLYSPIIETYIQEVKFKPALARFRSWTTYFLGQADFRGRLKVHTMIEGGKKRSFLWSFEPAGFLQMIYVDRGEFDKLHYRFKYSGREFLGEVRCLVFDITPAPKVRGSRFIGRIWVEDQDFTVVHISGTYTPTIHFSLKTFEDEYYLHFDSWRTNVKSGLWLPSYVYSQEINPATRFGNPSYKSSTHLWGYKLKQGSREEELSRLLVESANPVQDESSQHDRSPLEAQREWRHEAENNVLDLLERDGLLAPR